MGGWDSVGVDVPYVSLGCTRSASTGIVAAGARGWVARFAPGEPRLVYLSVSSCPDAQAHQMIPPFLCGNAGFCVGLICGGQR